MANQSNNKLLFIGSTHHMPHVLSQVSVTARITQRTREYELSHDANILLMIKSFTVQFHFFILYEKLIYLFFLLRLNDFSVSPTFAFVSIFSALILNF